MSKTDRVKSIARHIQEQNHHYSVTSCIFHINKPCLTLLNNFNSNRFHCLYANQSFRWRPYTSSKSCDIPEHFYDMIQLHEMMGDEYVLKFAGHLRESSGYTVGMFWQGTDLYTPTILTRNSFKETAFTLLVFHVAVCFRIGGLTPNMKQLSFVYTKTHPVLCDVGPSNSEKKERPKGDLDKKKWRKFLKHKTMLEIIRYLKNGFLGKYFQKKKKGKRCILNEENEYFDDETHQLICGSEKAVLVDVLKKFKHLMPDRRIRENLIEEWIASVEPCNE